MHKLAWVFLAGLLVALTSHSASAAPKYKTKIIYYTVSGTNDAQLYAAMNIGSGFFRHKQVYAFITSKSIVDGKYYQGKTCKLKGLRIRGDFVIRLPKLSSRAKISKSTKRRFKSFLRFVKRHEYRHRSDYISCFKRAERKIASIRVKSCKTFLVRTNAILAREGKRCERIARAFDAAESKRVVRQPFVRVAKKQATRKAVAWQSEAPRKRIAREVGDNR